MSLKGLRLACNGVTYELKRSVGQGGSGDVWLAEAQGRRWAVKFLNPDAGRKKTERFELEAGFQESGPHTNIVRVVGRGDHEGRRFYVMPHYPETLRDVINRGESDARTLLSYLQQVGEALQFAHQRKIVHRDVKPENVLVDGATAALADFGIAHFENSNLTSVGDLLGNRDYRAPEQRKGQDIRRVDASADVYALGLIVNECFTREVPAGPRYCSIEASHPLMSYLDAIVARMLAQSPGDRPAISDVLTEVQFHEARKNDEISEIQESLRLDEDVPARGRDSFDGLFRQASEDIWYAASLIATKTPDELDEYNPNWHMRAGYEADDFLLNLCVQSRLLDLCQRKFDYESNVYKRGDHYQPLDLDGDPRHQELYGQARALVSDHPLPPAFDSGGRILKTFASCSDYHCVELLSDARRVMSEVRENLLDAPILWLSGYLVAYAPRIRDVDDVADRISISWARSETFDQNDDDAELFKQPHASLDPTPVLEAFTRSWDVSVTRIGDERFSVMFRTPGEYHRFREHSLGLAHPHSVFEGDVMDLMHDAVTAGDITRLTLSSGFDVRSTLAKILGLRDDL